MGKRIDLVKKLQKEMDRRTEIENVAVQLISEGKCEEATALLSSLDDNVVKEIVDELERAEETVFEILKKTDGKITYRSDELPTGKEVDNIVRFWYGITEEQYKDVVSILREDISLLRDERKIGKKVIAALAATSAAIVGLLIKILCSLSK